MDLILAVVLIVVIGILLSAGAIWCAAVGQREYRWRSRKTGRWVKQAIVDAYGPSARNRYFVRVRIA